MRVRIIKNAQNLGHPRHVSFVIVIRRKQVRAEKSLPGPGQDTREKNGIIYSCYFFFRFFVSLFFRWLFICWVPAPVCLRMGQCVRWQRCWWWWSAPTTRASKEKNDPIIIFPSQNEVVSHFLTQLHRVSSQLTHTHTRRHVRSAHLGLDGLNSKWTIERRLKAADEDEEKKLGKKRRITHAPKNTGEKKSRFVFLVAHSVCVHTEEEPRPNVYRYGEIL